jgi:rhodanese-related sulfurtransferase
MKNKDFIYRTAYQAVAVVFISAVIGLCINSVRSDRVPLMGDWSAASQLTLDTGQNIEISIQDARQLCLENRAVILDARSPEEYQAGHIDCAVNVPWLSFDEHFQKIEELPEDKTIITYCDGESCSLSKDLAITLIDFGFKDVKVLVNGWSVWVQNSFPTKTGRGARFES